jgi:hypothetical protein
MRPCIIRTISPERDAGTNSIKKTYQLNMKMGEQPGCGPFPGDI